MIPLTSLRGIILPGIYNYDGHWFLGLRKDRVKRLFGTPCEWFDRPILKHFRFDFGLNVISLNRRRYWGNRHRKKVLFLLAGHYDLKCQVFDEHKQNFKEWDLNEDSLYRDYPKNITPMIAVRSRIDGGYVGDPEQALYLLRRGIAPQKRIKSSQTCSIGFCEREQKWYGWSHRAIFGFAIGHVAEEGSIATTSGWTDDYLDKHPEDDCRVPIGFRADSLGDCRRLACAFAESVS